MPSATATWPEQNAVVEWLSDMGIDVDPSDRLDLCERVTQYRLEVMASRDAWRDAAELLQLRLEQQSPNDSECTDGLEAEQAFVRAQLLDGGGTGIHDTARNFASKNDGIPQEIKNLCGVPGEVTKARAPDSATVSDLKAMARDVLE